MRTDRHPKLFVGELLGQRRVGRLFEGHAGVKQAVELDQRGLVRPAVRLQTGSPSL